MNLFLSTDDKILMLLNSVFLCIYVPVTTFKKLDIPVSFVPPFIFVFSDICALCLLSKVLKGMPTIGEEKFGKAERNTS